MGKHDVLISGGYGLGQHDQSENERVYACKQETCHFVDGEDVEPVEEEVVGGGGGGVAGAALAVALHANLGLPGV